ncbi:succinate dehydrogenase, hydrophobic membrane anchor protein [Rhabdochromatium marinum]|uniref:succinate dehydrogenase, hydrophobic membrane anchor protein n=1 Tax=Rhabdochromatium marinum TaxID=48729 RepID=UPI001906A30A|nr:succinate dehydrogenase, hydrophobic membrane anchor protein [Rhabdochromatium marinum]MBK1647759.1 succinate dehydrogenase, hydrophobic membrane anchor protein [Rhabdochromatium marinum]
MSRQAAGLKAWIIQRLSAVYIVLFGSYLAIQLVFAPPASQAEFVAWVAAPLVALGLLLYIPLLLLHAWVGIRDVLIDYIKPYELRVGVLSFFALLLLGSGVWAIQAVLVARAMLSGPGITG